MKEEARRELLAAGEQATLTLRRCYLGKDETRLLVLPSGLGSFLTLPSCPLRLPLRGSQPVRGRRCEVLFSVTRILNLHS